MSLKLKQTKDTKSWSQLAVEESDFSLKARNEVRQHTFRRMYMSVFIWFAAAFLFYCSLFYVGAFVDVGKVLGVSQAKRAAKVENNAQAMRAQQDRNLLSPISDALSINRVYLRKGQTIQATYSVPNGTQMLLSIKQCKRMPVLEIFTCNFKSEQERLIRNGRTGVVKFIATEPGFYYFEDQVTLQQGTTLKLNHDYKVIWQRA